MAKRMDWDAIYSMARRNIRPTYRRISRMDSNDWLASVGLERRNVATDIFAATSFMLLGCAIGVGVGMLVAPKTGTAMRKELNKKIRDTSERLGISGEHAAYAS